MVLYSTVVSLSSDTTEKLQFSLYIVKCVTKDLSFGV